MEDVGGCYFLTELVVTRVEVGRYATHRQKLANAVIGFRFIRFPSSMVVTDRDFNGDDDFKGRSSASLSRGKSCCFQIQSYCPTRAKVKIDVRRRLLDLTTQDDGLMQKIPSSAYATVRVGAIALDLGSAMAQILVKSASSGYSTPICKLFTKCFPLRNESKIPTGAITLQMRLTCFGKLGLPVQFNRIIADENEKGGGDASRGSKSRRILNCLPRTTDKGLMVSQTELLSGKNGLLDGKTMSRHRAGAHCGSVNTVGNSFRGVKRIGKLRKKQ